MWFDILSVILVNATYAFIIIYQLARFPCKEEPTYSGKDFIRHNLKLVETVNYGEPQKANTPFLKEYNDKVLSLYYNYALTLYLSDLVKLYRNILITIDVIIYLACIFFAKIAILDNLAPRSFSRGLFSTILMFIPIVYLVIGTIIRDKKATVYVMPQRKEYIQELYEKETKTIKSPLYGICSTDYFDYVDIENGYLYYEIYFEFLDTQKDKYKELILKTIWFAPLFFSIAASALVLIRTIFPQ